jgi:hypothetical protein
MPSLGFSLRNPRHLIVLTSQELFGIGSMRVLADAGGIEPKVMKVQGTIPSARMIHERALQMGSEGRATA